MHYSDLTKVPESSPKSKLDFGARTYKYLYIAYTTEVLKHKQQEFIYILGFLVIFKYLTCACICSIYKYYKAAA